MGFALPDKEIVFLFTFLQIIFN